MNLDQVQKYLLPHSDSFWNWNWSERSIQWKTGTTIAFAEELAAILERFIERGLPRMDCALLTIAALRESWSCLNENAEQDRSLRYNGLLIVLCWDREQLGQRIEQRVEEMCRRLLANLVIEDFRFELVEE